MEQEQWRKTGGFVNNHVMQDASIPNPALAAFSVLVGVWDTTGTHPYVPDTILHGRTSFAWLEGGAFLLMRSAIDDPRFPKGIAIIASDDSMQACFMLTFDTRKVSRKYEMTLRDNRWTWWRNDPGFLQRFVATIVDGGNTMIGKGEMSKDGSTWEKDLELTYKRVA